MRNSLLICLVAGALGCVAADHTVAVRNASSRELSDVRVQTSSRGFRFRFGILVPGATKGYSGSMRIQKDDICVLQWKESSGQENEAKIDLKKEAIGKFTGNLEFTLTESNSVTVKSRRK